MSEADAQCLFVLVVNDSRRTRWVVGIALAMMSVTRGEILE